jgi:hypothetical protein
VYSPFFNKKSIERILNTKKIPRERAYSVRCGTKCFLVEIESEKVKARTAIEARKTIRSEYGSEVQIVTVKEDRK